MTDIQFVQFQCCFGEVSLLYIRYQNGSRIFGSSQVQIQVLGIYPFRNAAEYASCLQTS